MICKLAVASAAILLQATSSHAFMHASKQFASVRFNRQLEGVSPLDVKSSKDDTNTKLAVADRHASQRKKWGVDNDADEEYWFNQKIHTLGNTGLTGAFHAAIAPLSTYLIDASAYDGVDIRHKVADELASIIHLNQGRILDLCCGVGMSTRALQDAFPSAKEVIGIDTSPEMIDMAKAINLQDRIVKPLLSIVESALKNLDNALQKQFISMTHKSRAITKAASKNLVSTCRQARFALANAEHTPFESQSFDLITIMYGFHEIPKKGRDTILREARRLLRKGGVLALIDISPDYTPSEQMLKGEPYVQEYQGAIDKQLRKFAGFKEWDKTLIPGHVKLWVLQRA